MVKKLVLVLFMLIFALEAFGEDVAETIYSIYLRNESHDTFYDNIIPTDTVRPGIDKIKGFTCRPLDDAGESWVSIFDSTDALMTGECFGEWEAIALGGGVYEDWARPKMIANGLHVRQGPSTEVILKFVRK